MFISRGRWFGEAEEIKHFIIIQYIRYIHQRKFSYSRYESSSNSDPLSSHMLSEASSLLRVTAYLVVGVEILLRELFVGDVRGEMIQRSKWETSELARLRVIRLLKLLSRVNQHRILRDLTDELVPSQTSLSTIFMSRSFLSLKNLLKRKARPHQRKGKARKKLTTRYASSFASQYIKKNIKNLYHDTHIF